MIDRHLRRPLPETPPGLAHDPNPVQDGGNSDLPHPRLRSWGWGPEVFGPDSIMRDTDEELAVKIVHAVARGAGDLVGCLSIARATGLPYGPGPDRRKSLDRIRSVAPLSARLAVDLYPDHQWITDSGPAYRLARRAPDRPT